MDTLTDLENAISAVQDAQTRADLWLHAGAQQANAGNYANAVTLLINAYDVSLQYIAPSFSRDYLLSEIAKQFASARDLTRARDVLQHIADDAQDEARARIAVQASVYNVSEALTDVAMIEDALAHDNALANVAYERAKQGALLEALDIVKNMSDTALIPGAQHQIIRLASEVIQ